MFKITFFPEKFVWVAHPEEIRITPEDLTSGDAIFVTGKLMDPEFVRQLTGRYIPFTAAVARDYSRGERGRGKDKTLLLEPKPGGMVLGVLLLKLTQADNDALDRFERVPETR
ncbi:MAG: gamma-glutamylcyclotransferase, partial [Candidatus Hydrogenedentota bacterium]